MEKRHMTKPKPFIHSWLYSLWQAMQWEVRKVPCASTTFSAGRPATCSSVSMFCGNEKRCSHWPSMVMHEWTKSKFFSQDHGSSYIPYDLCSLAAQLLSLSFILQWHVYVLVYHIKDKVWVFVSASSPCTLKSSPVLAIPVPLHWIFKHEKYNAPVCNKWM